MLRPDGSQATYPHLIERAKPGVIIVDQSGRRFCDEAGSYHDVVAAWIAASPASGPLRAWVICDRCALWRYGLGMVKPYSLLSLRARRQGYLIAASTIEGLARKSGIDSRGLLQTIHQLNNCDPDQPEFKRGRSAYDQSQGDPQVKPNPCVGPILKAPFFAVRLLPGSLGTLAGLNTDAYARVLNRHDAPIPGLYACGNDMAAVMGGHYPANGVTLGSALIFGHQAGLQAAAKTRAAAA
jgi:succinate dehydrogenase/fumarate reductase flavoprotein subunit